VVLGLAFRLVLDSGVRERSCTEGDCSDAAGRSPTVALVIRGRLVPMADDPHVADAETAAFAGAVWVDDDGVVEAVTKGRRNGPAGYDDAPVVDVGTDLVLPGFIDLHSHLAYNTLPLWSVDDRERPFLHHNSWPGHRSYAASLTWPAYALITAAPHELLAYVETKALVGGTTTIQGSPPHNRPRDGWLVRNAEDETFGTRNADLVYASTLTLDTTALGSRATAMRTRSALFIYHCAEGQRGSLAAREYTAAAHAGCLQRRFVAVHCNAVDPAVFQSWRDPGAVVWSPLSNLWLYGQTTDVPAALAAGVAVCLGSDWAPSGSRNVLGELKVARLVADSSGWDLSDLDLVRMVTSTPGDVLAQSWPHRVGRLQPGAAADLVVLRAGRRADPFHAVVHARENDVRLVIVGGRLEYGTEQLMAPVVARTTAVDVAGERRALTLASPDATTPWSWDEVVAGLEAVRREPKRSIDAARALLANRPFAFHDPRAPLRLALDMPTGVVPVGGLPKDLDVIDIPPLEPLATDDAWLASLAGRGYHGGLLDRLGEVFA